ncbi:MAG TPA: glycosyltransferase family 4 protein [Bryobacteraceae bacterium]|nr:glycosyltransferase family 4 protein [Bryobacteraceae bacterium]
MKILALTAGAANMYCGSCLRDNALAAELKRQGHDVILLPIYTPTLTDEPNVSDAHVFFGGISVYLEQHSALFRKTPWILDRIWDSRWALKLASKRNIPVNPKLLGEMTVSMLRGEDGFQGKEIRKLTAWLRLEARDALAPDVVTLPNSLLIGLARPIREAVNRPVCCTLQGEDLFLSQLPESYRSQSLDLIRANLDQIDGFVAVSEFYAEYMCRYLGIPERKMQVAQLGINLEGYTPREGTAGGGFRVGYFARVAPEKGLHVLAESYLLLRRRGELPECTLEVAGYLAPEHREYLRGVERTIAAAGFAAEFRYRGVLDRAQKLEFLASLDVLSVPGTYDEPKGIFLLEALASGVPVVQPRRGAFPEILRRTGGGLLVEPNDPSALAEGILTLYRDRDHARELGRRGAQGVREHYGVERMAARVLEVYRGVANPPVHA